MRAAVLGQIELLCGDKLPPKSIRIFTQILMMSPANEDGVAQVPGAGARPPQAAHDRLGQRHVYGGRGGCSGWIELDWKALCVLDHCL